MVNTHQPHDPRELLRWEIAQREESGFNVGEHAEAARHADPAAARQLLDNPGFGLVCVVTLALGIAASTAIFSAVNPILFQPLPYPHADGVMMLEEARNNGSPRRPTFATFHGLAEGSRSFDAMAVMKPWQPAMVGIGQPERFEGRRVSAGSFRTLGVLASMGQDFQGV